MDELVVEVDEIKPKVRKLKATWKFEMEFDRLYAPDHPWFPLSGVLIWSDCGVQG
jgi:hypothetical protein